MSVTDRELPELLTSAQLAKYLGVSMQTLYNWRKAGLGPPAVRMPGLRFRAADVAEWLERQKERTL